MNAHQFSEESPGKLVPIEFNEYPNGPFAEPVKVKTVSFVPACLPPDLDWRKIKLDQFDRILDTISALSKLDGLHKRVGNASRLLRTLWMREAA